MILIKSLLQLHHEFFISDLASVVSSRPTLNFPSVKLHHHLFYCQPVLSTCIIFIFVLKSSTAINGVVVLFYGEKPAARKSDNAVWEGTCKYLRNATVCSTKD
jgi:hypothetical protein